MIRTDLVANMLYLAHETLSYDELNELGMAIQEVVDTGDLGAGFTQIEETEYLQERAEAGNLVTEEEYMQIRAANRG